MRPPNPNNPHYKSLESLENIRLPVQEYIPRDFLRVRHPHLSWVGAFLIALAGGASVKSAADRAGISRGEVYFERENNPAFREAWEDAIRMSTEGLEGAAHERALEKSDLLMMFLLKARRPEIYNEKYQAQKNATIAIQINHHYPASNDQPTSIEVHNRAEVTDSEESTGGPDDSIDVTPQKD